MVIQHRNHPGYYRTAVLVNLVIQAHHCCFPYSPHYRRLPVSFKKYQSTEVKTTATGT